MNVRENNRFSKTMTYCSLPKEVRRILPLGTPPRKPGNRILASVVVSRCWSATVLSCTMLLGMFLKIIFKVFKLELRHSAPCSASRPRPTCSFLIRGTVCHLSKCSLGMMLPSHWATISSLRVFRNYLISLSRRSRLSSPIDLR